MLDRLADCMMFGAMEPCGTCGGQFVFRSGVGYQCMGNVSEWTKCQEVSFEPERKEFKLPKDYKADFDFCKLYKWKKGKSRIIPNNPSSQKSQSQGSSQGSIGGRCVHWLASLITLTVS